MESRKGRWKGLVILAWFYISGSTVLARNLERYDTAYECEGKTLRIECREGELIHLIRANYGRFSITICNEHGNTDWSVNCMSPKSFRVLYSKCNQQQNCSIVASTSQFGDPCPNTLKYLEAHYQCVSASTTTTTSRPSPPWLLTSVWSTGPSATQASGGSSTASSIGGRSPSRITTPARANAAQPASSASSTAAPSASSAPSRPSSTRAWTEDESIEDEEDEEDEEEPAAPLPPEDAIGLEPTQEPRPPTAEHQTPQPPFTSSTLAPWNTSRRTPTGNVYNGQRDCESPKEKVRNLWWKSTRVNETAVQNCPGGAHGQAYWRCRPAANDGKKGVWERGTPNLTECRSIWLSSLAKRVREGELILGVSSELSQVTKDNELYGGDMLITTEIIRNMTDKMAKDVGTYQDPRQKEASVAELLQGAVTTGSNLLDKPNSWKDLSYREQKIVATSLLVGLEKNAFLLADTLVSENRTFHKSTNILMEVRVLDAHNLENEVVVFPREEDRRDSWAKMSVELTRDVLLRQASSKDHLVRLVFMAFDRLEEILQPQSDEEAAAADQLSINEQREPDSSSQQQQQQQQQQTEKQLRKPNATGKLNSKVISASLGEGQHISLAEGGFVRLHFQHLSDKFASLSCVFWNFSTNGWSDDGCFKLQTNETHTTCQCNHLTNFAILMDVHGIVGQNDVHDRILHSITYIGCSISVVCLVLAIITFQLFRGLKSDRTTIHKNLCICLLIAEVVFICGIGQTSEAGPTTFCRVIAGLLHFFFLCAFAWMFLEGFQLYVMLIEVFEAEKSRLRWYYLVAYGAPLLVVGISCVIDPLSYGTPRYCWLRVDNYFIYSFVGPVILVILANLVFLSMAIYMMCRHANTTVSMKSKEHSRLASARAWLRGAIVLVFLLGLTWSFGLLYLDKKDVIMAYIFTVLNSLQGLFIFVFHCVQNEKVRKEYRKFIRRHSWLPKCLRCSKGSSSGGSGGSGAGAGANGSHGNSHGGSHAGKDFASHNTSSNPSAPTTDSSGLSPHANSNYLASTGRGGWGTLQREHHAAPGTVVDASDSSPCATPQPGLHHAVSTLPYVRHHHHHLQYQQQHQQLQQQQLNHHHHHHQQQQQQHHASTSLYPQAPNIPKSATATWGPLNKNLTWKNISFKSQSRDSGHGGSEQEDSPRVLGQPGYGHSAMTLQGYSLRARERRLLGELEVGSRATTGRRAASPYNHTYTEIRDARHQQHLYGQHQQQQQHVYGLGQLMQDDPVYEEIERAQGVLGIGGCPEVAQAASDMSDEDGRRQSDMSRQSSRSYGDHRPLIPYSPAAERGLEAAWALEKLRRQHHQASTRPELLDQQQAQLRPQQQQQQQQPDHTRTVAVLDGHTVVCHLQPQTELYAARGLAPPSYSEC